MGKQLSAEKWKFELHAGSFFLRGDMEDLGLSFFFSCEWLTASFTV